MLQRAIIGLEVVRIVSLIASATEIIHALGLTRLQVGRSHECDYPEAIRALPVCTRPSIPVDGSSAEIDALVRQRIANAVSVYEVFTGVLDRLRPTHIVTQTHCRVCAVSLEDVEKALCGSIRSRPKLVSLEPNSLSEIWADIRRVADACGVPERGEQVVRDLQSQMQKVSKICHRAKSRPKIACIEWIEPLMPAGNWIPELVQMTAAGNVSAPAEADVVLVFPCGFDLQRISSEMHWLTDRPEWKEWKAVQEGEVYLIDGNQYMNRPGPRITDSLRIIAEIAHPEALEPTLEGTGWLHWTG